MYSKGKRKRTHLELLQHEYQYLSSETSGTQNSAVEAETLPRKELDLSTVYTRTMSSSTSSPTNIDNILVDGDDLHTLAPISAGTDWSRFTREVIDDMVDHVSTEYVDKEGPSRIIVPKFMKHEGLQACFRASQLKKDLEECILLLKNISLSESPLQIHSTLCSVEARVLSDKEEARRITRSEAIAILEDAAAMVRELESSLKDWRSLYPDNSPIRIDNASAFVDPSKTYLVPTLMAYSLVLSQRIFAGASELSANATLQVMRLYGSTVAALG
ncbi:hypothetical protein F5878DRAFT_648200, partial [Lentinula raphanica]